MGRREVLSLSQTESLATPTRALCCGWCPVGQRRRPDSECIRCGLVWLMGLRAIVTFAAKQLPLRQSTPSSVGDASLLMTVQPVQVGNDLF